MMKIVLIDGLIDKTELEHPDRIVHTAFPLGLNMSNIGRSHATTIAQILERMTRNYYLENYVILQSDDSTSIQFLVQGLQYCVEQRPDIVIISLGSMIPADGLRMYPLVQELNRIGCKIFAAQSNNGILTYPASLPGVIAVQRDYFDLMLPYSYCVESNHPLGVNITINCRRMMEKMSIAYRNSFVTPVVASIYCNHLSRNASNIFKYFEMTGRTYVRDDQSLTKMERKCRVCICSNNPDISFSNQVLKGLNQKWKVHSIGLQMASMGLSHPCWMRIDEKKDISLQVRFFEEHCFCDLVLISISSKYLSKIISELEIDIMIKICQNGHMAWRIDRERRRGPMLSAMKTAEYIVQALT